jgi:mannose-6-phosphate isomerase class I
VRPLVLGPNQPRRFYRGGGAIARFRGLEQTGEYMPEDWVGSATSVFGDASAGLTRLDGTTLRDALAADPDAFFGRPHGERHGGDPGLLVKLLDAGERLPVHCHPDRAFARGLGLDRALECVDRSRLEPDRLASLDGGGVRSLFPAEADPFFRAERLGPTASLEPAFSILVVLEGAGRLETERGGELALERGQTVLVPYASGQARLVGEVDVVRCLPPEVG